MKLTETELDYYVFGKGFCERETMDYDEERVKRIHKQILENQEKAEKWTELMNVGGGHFSVADLMRENKQLKSEIERISDKLGNELQEKYLETEQLKDELKTLQESQNGG